MATTTAGGVPSDHAPPDSRRMVSQPQRYLILFVLGLLVGIVGAVFALRAWQERQNPLPHATMHVMDHQIDTLKQSIAQNRCTVSDVLPRLQALRAVGNDLEAVFPDLAEDTRFGGHASQLRATLDAALAAPPGTCQAASAALKKVGEACKACHEDFAH
ncbi:MAG: hypothetical protein QM601_07940 [Pseudoxanthomonas sp.]